MNRLLASVLSVCLVSAGSPLPVRAQALSGRTSAAPAVLVPAMGMAALPAAPLGGMASFLPAASLAGVLPGASLETAAGPLAAPSALPAPQAASPMALLQESAPRLEAAAALPDGQTAEGEFRAVYDQGARGAAPDDGPLPVSEASASADPLFPYGFASDGRARHVPTPIEAHQIAQRERARFLAPYVRKYAAPVLAAGVGLGALILSPAGVLPAALAGGALVFSVLLHESAHLWALKRYGDSTPESAGRHSLNPLHHIDPIGTVLYPAAVLAVSMAAFGVPAMFGWAKRVPADFNKLVDPKVETAKVAAWGVAANAALAAAAGLALLAFGGVLAPAGTAHFVLSTVFQLNGALALFNLLPLPWLDGGKILVGLAPKSAWARWIYNPALPKGPYQDFFQRIYKGPSNLLTRFGIKSQDQVNGLTTALTFAALAAVYGVFYSIAAVPLLFLVLPCSYDYWCIREKARSEAAVQEMMKFMGEWGSVMVQVAEDLGAQSEASAHNVELHLVYATDGLLEKLMDQEEFRKLSEEDKLKEFMRQFPEHAVKVLKYEGDEGHPPPFAKDSEDKIREILADPRNQPYKDRLEKWLKDWEIFQKMASPHAKKKLKAAIDEAQKDKTRQAGE